MPGLGDFVDAETADPCGRLEKSIHSVVEIKNLGIPHLDGLGRRVDPEGRHAGAGTLAEGGAAGSACTGSAGVAFSEFCVCTGKETTGGVSACAAGAPASNAAMAKVDALNIMSFCSRRGTQCAYMAKLLQSSLWRAAHSGKFDWHVSFPL